MDRKGQTIICYIYKEVEESAKLLLGSCFFYDLTIYKNDLNQEGSLKVKFFHIQTQLHEVIKIMSSYTWAQNVQLQIADTNKQKHNQQVKQRVWGDWVIEVL